MKTKTPAAQGGRGRETLGGGFSGPVSLAAYRAQVIAARYSISIETAAMLAALAFGGGSHHG